MVKFVVLPTATFLETPGPSTSHSTTSGCSPLTSMGLQTYAGMSLYLTVALYFPGPGMKKAT